MQELTFEQVEEVSGGAVVFLIPPAVGAVLKGVGMVAGFVGSAVAGYAATQPAIEMYDRVMGNEK